jgi:hypothetical protein
LGLALGLAIPVVLGVVPAAGRQAIFSDPYREEQVAFANGFKSGLLYVHQELSEGRMDIRELGRLARNKGGRLEELLIKAAKEYQATLIKLNPGRGSAGGTGQGSANQP